MKWDRLAMIVLLAAALAVIATELTRETDLENGRERAMAVHVLEFTDGNFQSEVLEAGEPVLVDFWAPWCGPCKMLTPTIEELAQDYSGKVRVGKMNTDENPQTATAHGISAIPTIMLFKDGKVADKFVGVVPKDKLSAALDKQL